MTKVVKRTRAEFNNKYKFRIKGLSKHLLCSFKMESLQLKQYKKSHFFAK